jgi:subtilisin family serine protease
MQFSLGGAGASPPGRVPAGRLRRLFAAGTVVVMAALTTATVASPATAAPATGAKIDKQVLDEIAKNGSTKLLVYMKARADLSAAAAQPNKSARAGVVYNQLTSVATSSQASLTGYLKSKNITYTSYWIANALTVTGDKALVNTIAGRSDVSGIAPVKRVPLVEPVLKTDADVAPKAVEWGLTNIEAPRVWNELGVRGEGIVVANIDTGVQFDHPALVGKYRGNTGNGTFDHNYNWSDPTGVCGQPSVQPCDNQGHGTHTMGTMVGDDGAGNQTGVAPGAKWIAAKGCAIADCPEDSLLAAGQWVIAPTNLAGANPRPDLHPDIVNNSWGGGGNDPWYRATVQAWVAAGIMPVFANGNAGPSCQTAGSPGDLPETYAVGAYDISNNIASFSSRGASLFDSAIKPNVAAPGVNVRSAAPGNGYASMSGTSMATPHVAGTVALIWSASAQTRGDIAATRALLDDGATDVDSLGCGGTIDFNNTFGEGRLNAYQSVLAAPRGPNNRVLGLVTDAATGAPLAGATVASGTVSAKTGADGRYSLTLPYGEHTLTATQYGYAPQSAVVTVGEGPATTKDFALTKLPVVTVSGRVTDGSGHGWPLYARIDVGGREGPPVYTNPVTGAYSFEAPGSSTYRLTVTAHYPGYVIKTDEVVVGSANVEHNISVPVLPACTAPGYAESGTPVLSESFDAPSTPAGWSVVKRQNGAEWAFNDPGSRGNLTGGTGGFAIADGDHAGSGTTTDTDLITPAVDLTGVPNPIVRFNSDFRDLGTEDFADIEVSTDGGATWTTAWHQTDTRRGPVTEEVPLTAAAGQANVKLKFRYTGTWDWWWEIDNVTIVNRSCDPVPGGIVVGFTTDGVTGQPLTGVTVTSDGKPAEKGVSVTTPDDANIPDGFYWLFSSLTGAQPFTATKAPYQPARKSVTVVADSVTRADFALAGSRLTVTPAKIESYQNLGQTRTTTVTVRNTGTAPAQVELFERGGDFRLLNRRGAPEQRIEIPGGMPTGYAPKAPTPAVRPAAIPTVDDSWVQIDDAPSSTSDNSAAWVAGKVYSVGGGGGTGTENKVFIYDPSTEDWSTGANMPRGRSKPQAAALAGKLYVFGGWDTAGNPIAAVDVFDPASGAWSTLPVTNPRPTAGAGVAVVGGVAYIVGGCGDGSCTQTAQTLRFDPAAGSFDTMAPYPHPVSWLACGGIGTRAYCAGGVATAAFTDAFSYDPAANSWTPIAPMPASQWGAQETSGGGLLVLAGGIEGLSTLVNRTVAYDPGTNSWRNLPNANFPRARGAGACGMYKIGGWSAPFVPEKQAEFLGGLDTCQEAADLPWLSENPQSFTLAPGASQVVTVTLAATTEAGVWQPGDYQGQIGVRSDSPYPVNAVEVTMHVLPPNSWGKITGSVVGQSCSGSTTPLSAQIQISLVTNPDITYAVKPDPDGAYSVWLPRGRYDVIASKDAWAAQVKRHTVRAGFVDPLDFVLKPFGGCNSRLGGV